MIRDLKEKTYLLEQSYQEAERLRIELSREKETLKQEKELFEKQRADILVRARNEADSYLRTVKRAVSYTHLDVYKRQVSCRIF